MYTLGNILALCSSMFLCGPKGQWKNMSKEGRRVTSIVYVVALTLTLTVCFVTFPKDLRALQGLLILVLLAVEIAAMVWYSLSYIPYGRATAKSCCLSYCCCCMEESNVWDAWEEARDSGAKCHSIIAWQKKSFNLKARQQFYLFSCLGAWSWSNWRMRASSLSTTSSLKLWGREGGGGGLD